MHPILVNLHIQGRSIDISSYRFFLILAVAAVLIAGSLSAIRRGFPARKVLATLLASVVASFAGARIFHATTHVALYVHDLARLFALTTTGFSLYGGLIAAVISIAVACRFFHLNFWRLADSLIPATGLGIGIARIGCFLNGCCFGKETSLPWGAIFPKGSAPYLYEVGKTAGKVVGAFGFAALRSLDNFSPHPVHPTQLYECVTALVLAALAIQILKREAPDGLAVSVFAASFTSFRWLNSGLRVAPPTYTSPAWFDPVLYGAIVFGSLFVIAKRASACVERGKGRFRKRGTIGGFGRRAPSDFQDESLFL